MTDIGPHRVELRAGEVEVGEQERLDSVNVLGRVT
jgi:hypothetical protein